jgi:hypothetical protein
MHLAKGSNNDPRLTRAYSMATASDVHPLLLPVTWMMLDDGPDISNLVFFGGWKK